VKEQRLLVKNAEHASQIRAINKEIDQFNNFKRELQEAHNVAKLVEKVINKAFSKLKKVKQFQSRTMKGVGSQSSYIKKSYIDGAIKDISEINFYLGKLDKELSEVYSRYTFFSIYKYQNFVESFYDNLITDWVLQNKLKNAINCLQTANDQTKRILATLTNDLTKTDKSIEEKVNQKKELVRKN